MFERLKAWKAFINMVKWRVSNEMGGRDYLQYFRKNIILVLQEEKFFDFLDEPRAIDEIISHFRYSDTQFLARLLEILTKDETIVKVNSKYQTNRPLVIPEQNFKRFFGEAAQELWFDFAKAIPDRLRGEYKDFTGGVSLYNWDEALNAKVYDDIRKIAFAYSGALKSKEPGVFLDLGCGNGYGTAAIWVYYLLRRRFQSPMKFIGLDTNDDLLRIAREEFPMMVNHYFTNFLSEQNQRNFKKHAGYFIKDFKEDASLLQEISKMEEYFPEFKKGDAKSIPFEDNSFDWVFASQVLHWTNPRTAIKEMIRVTKPGGYVIGVETLFPIANEYNNLHYLVIKGAYGNFWKKDLEQWGKEAGGFKTGAVTPVGAFKIQKRK